MRRVIIAGGLVAAFVGAGCAPRALAKPQPQEETAWCRCRPGLPCWPTAADWQGLKSSLTGMLEEPRSPLLPCSIKPAGDACAAAIRDLKNPFYIQDQPGGTESAGWLGAWTAAVSAYAVAAESPEDIVAAVKFARRHRLRLVVKGTGHDYLGRSNAPDSLLVWTHKMRKITMHDAFVGGGCANTEAGSPAVTLEAGTRWLEAYQEVTVKHGRYVQGGGCTSVGAAGGFIQGGGFGSWSKKYGTSAASMLEAELVTADGALVVANACQNQDLFWAVRGGGGGTFGIITRVTLRTHPLPNFFGVVHGGITATSDAAFQELLERFLVFYGQRLNNEHWGEQVRVKRNNLLELSLSFQGMSALEAQQLWQPFRAWLEQRRDAFSVKMEFAEIPGREMWDYAALNQRLPGALARDLRPGQPADRFWWAGDGGQVSVYWYAYQSRWIPVDGFEAPGARTLAAALFEASRHWSCELHFNKGQAGASAEAIERGKQTSMNPAVYKAAALLITGSGGHGFPGVSGHEPKVPDGERNRVRVSAAMKIIRDATPGAGSYVNETDFFEPDWQRAFWGENYPRLLAIKRKYDAEGLFFCHHCVGSESWSSDGMCKLR